MHNGLFKIGRKKKTTNIRTRKKRTGLFLRKYEKDIYLKKKGRQKRGCPVHSKFGYKNCF
jgi:hypothetical protein